MSAIADAYDDDVLAVRDGLAAFVRREIVPRYDGSPALFDEAQGQFDARGRFRPELLTLLKEVRMASAGAGYYGMCVPTELGGAGLGHVAWFGAWEQVFHSCGGKYQLLGEMAVAHWATGPSAVLAQLTPQARERMLPGLLSGEQTMCFGMSEPGAGSDAMMMKTRAVREGDGWRITGSKIWTTNGPYADYCIVFAVTDPAAAAQRKGGISAFLVPTSSPGFRIQQVIRMWGQAGGYEAQIALDEVRVEPSQLVGELDRGFAIAMLGVNLGRLYNCARAVGLGRWAIETAFEYAKVREAFGKPIASYQAVVFPLVDAATQLHAAHLMALNVARLLDAGRPARKELSMAKLFALQAAAAAVDKAIQAHGAIGFTNEMHLGQVYQLLRILNIADGTNEILRRTITKEMLAGDLDL